MKLSLIHRVALLVMLCCWFAVAGGQTCIETDDDRLEAAIQEAIDEYPYLKTGTINIEAVNGKVTLRGHVFSEKAQNKLKEVVEGVEGVTELRFHVIVSHGEGSTNPMMQDTGFGFGG